MKKNCIIFLLSLGVAIVAACENDSKNSLTSNSSTGSKESGGVYTLINDNLFKYASEGDAIQVASLLEKGADPNYVKERDKTTLKWNTDSFPEYIQLESASYSNDDVYKKVLDQLKAINIPIDIISETERSVTFSGHYVDIALPLMKGWSISVNNPESVPSSVPRRKEDTRNSKGLTEDRSIHSWGEGGLFTLSDGSFEWRLSHEVELGHVDESPTPLMVASYEGHLEVVRLLIQKGAKVNYKWENRAPSALMHACAGGHIAIVTELLNAGAKSDVNYKDHSGDTALSIAVAGDHSDIVKVLIDAGAKAAKKISLLKETEFEKAIMLGDSKKLTTLLADSEMDSRSINEAVNKAFKVFGYKETPRTGGLDVPSHSSLRPLLDSLNLDSDSINRLFVWIVSNRHYRYEAEFRSIFNDPRISQDSLDWAMEYGKGTQGCEDLIRQLLERNKL
jgi:hypothetical protein